MYEQITVKELFATIGTTCTIRGYLVQGLKMHNPALTALAMQELAKRGDYAIIEDVVVPYITLNPVKLNTAFAWVLAKSLEEHYKHSYMLYAIGHGMTCRIAELAEGSDGEDAIFNINDLDLGKAFNFIDPEPLKFGRKIDMSSWLAKLDDSRLESIALEVDTSDLLEGCDLKDANRSFADTLAASLEAVTRK